MDLAHHLMWHFETELHSEIEKIYLFDNLPNNWTYPLIQPKLLEEANRRGVLQIVKSLNINLYEDHKILVMDSRVAKIRESERKSHTEIYTNETLYSSGGWLGKPIKTVKDIIPLFQENEKLRVLDLGCGVGRNSIFIADKYVTKECQIDCVDILEIAIEKLRENADEHSVAGSIHGFVDTIENFSIAKDSYDLIIAVSALEHVESEDVFLRKLHEIKYGIKPNGMVCLVVNSEVREKKMDTNEELEPQFEVNFLSEELQSYIDSIFCDFETIKNTLSLQEYDVPRDGFISHLTTKVITFVGRRPMSY